MIHAQDVAEDVVRPAVEDVRISYVLVRAGGEVLFELPKRMPVRFSLYDVAGKAVLELKEAVYEPGRHSVTFSLDGFHSGVYFCRIETPGGSAIRKFVVFR